MRAIGEALAAAARERPDAVRVVDPDGRAWTNSEIAAGARSVEAEVRAACRPGSVVPVDRPSGGAFWAACLGVTAAGCDALPIANGTPETMRERIRREVAPDGCDPAVGTGGVILLSSGTTGRSRLVRRRPEAIDAIAAGLVEQGLVRDGDVVGSFLPMHHAYGFEHAFLGPLLAGAEVRQGAAFTPDAAATLVASGVSVFPTVPPALATMLDGAWEASGVRLIVVAGTRLHPSLRGRFAGRFGIPLVDLYGASELGTVWLDRGDGGVPVRGVEIRIVDHARTDRLVDVPLGSEGEIAVRSVTALERFLGAAASEPPTREGWFRTGDLGRRVGNERWAVTGRVKLVFDVGGLKVNPFDVEAAIEEHPGVRAAVVTPIEVEGGLMRVAARVEPAEVREGLDPHAIRAFLRDRVAAHAVPRSIEIVARLPRTASGKVRRDPPAVADEPKSPTRRRPEGLERRDVRERWTRDLFDGTADGYDASSGVAFLGSGRWYRRRMLRMAGLGPGRTLVDVGGGTGACGIVAQELVGPTGRVVAVDPSPGMLSVARRRGVRETVEGRAESIPLPDACADVVSMGYMLRHVDDLRAAFREARRVLKPLGRIVVLEVTAPDPGRPVARRFFRVAMRELVPAVGVVASGRPSTFRLMRYWADTIECAVRPEEIVAALADAGFAGVRHHLELGIFSSYRGTRPA